VHEGRLLLLRLMVVMVAKMMMDLELRLRLLNGEGLLVVDLVVLLVLMLLALLNLDLLVVGIVVRLLLLLLLLLLSLRWRWRLMVPVVLLLLGQVVGGIAACRGTNSSGIVRARSWNKPCSVVIILMITLVGARGRLQGLSLCRVIDEPRCWGSERWRTHLMIKLLVLRQVHR